MIHIKRNFKSMKIYKQNTTLRLCSRNLEKMILTKVHLMYRYQLTAVPSFNSWKMEVAMDAEDLRKTGFAASVLHLINSIKQEKGERL